MLNIEKLDLPGKWHWIESWFVSPSRWLTNIIFFTTIPVLLIYHFFPKLFYLFPDKFDRTDTLLSIIIFIMSGVMKYTFYHGDVFKTRLDNLGHIIANGSLTQHKQEVDALSILPTIMSELPIKRIDLIQMSGQNVVPLITVIAQKFPSVKFRLLLLDADISSANFDNQKHDKNLPVYPLHTPCRH